MAREFISLLLSKKEVPYYYFKYLYRKDIDNYLDYVSTKEANRIKRCVAFHNEENLSLITSLIFAFICEHTGIPIPVIDCP